MPPTSQSSYTAFRSRGISEFVEFVEFIEFIELVKSEKRKKKNCIPPLFEKQFRHG